MIETVIGLAWFSWTMLAWMFIDKSHKEFKMLGFVVNTVIILAYIYANEAGMNVVPILRGAVIADAGILFAILIFSGMGAITGFFEGLVSVVKRVGRV